MKILSKNSSLEESLEKMTNTLKSVGSEITFAEEKHPLTNCYSVNLSSNDAPKHLYSNGKGTCSEASIVSAIGEYIERLQTNNFFIEFYIPNRDAYPDQKVFSFDEEYLDKDLVKFYNKDNELTAEDFVDYHSDHFDKVVSLPFVNLSTNKKAYLPINLTHNLYVSNGLATGNTPKEAQVQSLSEIFERYVKIEIIKEGYALPTFPKEALKNFTKLNEDIKSLEDLGYIIEVLDCSFEGKFPVTAISLVNPKTSTLFVSFGAHPILEVSLQRTMTELMQGRDLSDLAAFEKPSFDRELIQTNSNIESHFIDSNGKIGFEFLSAKKTFSYTSWPYNGSNTDEEYDYLINITKTMKKDIYIREYNYLNFYSCQIIVPGVSEVYPLEDMIYNNTNAGKLIRDMVLNFKEYNPEEILDALESFDNNLNVEKYIGVIFANNFTICDFKAQLNLMLGNYEEAIELFEMSTQPLAYLLSQLVRMYLNETSWEDYEVALNNVFTKEKVDQATKIFNGEEDFTNVTYHQDYLNILDLYDRLWIKKLNK
ncbi:MAG: YcaO-like family protein [Campylobacteraceae bacterium]|nr:YcaO-like family protein [Campylobacteraceae bacterium]